MIAPLRDFDSDFYPPKQPVVEARRAVATAYVPRLPAAPPRPAIRPWLATFLLVAATALYLGLLFKTRA